MSDRRRGDACGKAQDAETDATRFQCFAYEIHAHPRLLASNFDHHVASHFAGLQRFIFRRDPCRTRLVAKQ
jgi:hypothetical protein